MTIHVQVYLDGHSRPYGFENLLHEWRQCWSTLFPTQPDLQFEPEIDLKTAQSLPAVLDEVAYVRNPDVFFRLREGGHLLGGVEVTTHSPDGSNIEKRYPYLWASREHSIPAFVASPYQKQRPTGSVNRLPRRHMERNLIHLQQWEVSDPETAPIQLLAVREMHGYEESQLEVAFRAMMPSWMDLARFFAARTAQFVAPSERLAAEAVLADLRESWIRFTNAAIARTTYEDAATLLKLPDRWIQTYNARPDTGHWERGEGQFDSIDGRLMFTLEAIEFTPTETRPSSLEFWLPQIVSSHPWIVEQADRGYGSKRLRNIVQVLPVRARVAEFLVKFADQLTSADWAVLQNNPSLSLARLDASPQLINLSTVLAGKDLQALGQNGLRNPANAALALEGLSEFPGAYLSTHRASIAGWEVALSYAIDSAPNLQRLFLPRIPEHLLAGLVPATVDAVPAEHCTKAQLLALRQLNRAGLLR